MEMKIFQGKVLAPWAPKGKEKLAPNSLFLASRGWEATVHPHSWPPFSFLDPRGPGKLEILVHPVGAVACKPRGACGRGDPQII